MIDAAGTISLKSPMKMFVILKEATSAPQGTALGTSPVNEVCLLFAVEPLGSRVLEIALAPSHLFPVDHIGSGVAASSYIDACFLSIVA